MCLLFHALAPGLESSSGGWCVPADAGLASCSQGTDIVLAHGEDSGLPLQVLTSADEFATVRSGLQALGIAVAEDRSGLVFTPLSTIEVWQLCLECTSAQHGLEDLRMPPFVVISSTVQHGGCRQVSKQCV